MEVGEDMEGIKVIRMQEEKKVDASFILYHLGSIKEESLIETIENYYSQIRIPSRYTIEVIVTIDGGKVEQLKGLQEKMSTYKEPLIIIEVEEGFLGPAKLWNKALEVCGGEMVAFTHTGVKWHLDSLLHLNRLMVQNRAQVSYGPVKGKEGSQAGKSLEYMLIRKSVARSLGGFCEEIEQTPLVDWEFVRRLEQISEIVKLNGKSLVLEDSLENLPYPYVFKQSRLQLMRKYFITEADAPLEEKFHLTEHDATHKANTTFLVYHHKSMLEDDLIYTIESYSRQRGIQEAYGIEIIVLLDDISIKDLPILEQIVLRNLSQLIVLETKQGFEGPGLLWNKGLKIATGDWLVFTWTGALWYEDSLIHLRRLAMKSQVAAYGLLQYKLSNKESSYTPKTVGMGNLATQFVPFINAIPLCYMVVKKSIAEELQGFVSEKEYARLVDWEFTLRLTKRFKVEALAGKMAHAKSALGTTAFDYGFRTTCDEQIRTLMMHTSPKTKYKIAIISGLNESAQVQLCLLNYFEKSELEGTFSWRRFVESEVIPEELAGYDLVFFIRSRTLGALEAAKFCLEKEIKTVYLLDDNWFCATQTYPQLESQIGRQSMPYFFFTLLISIVDCIFVYSDLLEEDIKIYNPCVIKMPINVNTSHFSKTTLKGDGLIHIGFAGSGSKIQHFSEAFKALERVMNRFANVCLYFKGIELPATFNVFADRVIQESYTLDYKDYAKQVSNWHYDIMISPLEDTRYINSKCVNKYLEITAAGATGIYTNIPLYQKVIKNGENGLLIDNEENQWYQALEYLILNENPRQEMFLNAQKDILKQYETTQVVPTFLEAIKKVLGRGGVL